MTPSKQGAQLSTHECWQKCKSHLRKQMPAFLYQTMIEVLQAIPSKNSNSKELDLFAPSEQIANRVSQRYLPMIQDFLLHSTPFQGQLRLGVRKKENIFFEKEQEWGREIPSRAVLKEEKIQAPPSVSASLSLFKGSSFESFLQEENFCISEINQVQLRQLWQMKGGLYYLYGPEGSGKTTIAKALQQGREKLRMRTRMLRLQDFLSELALAAQKRDSTSWNQRLRSYDCLVIDDFQYMKPQALRSQEELSYLIDEFLQKGKRLLFCADRSLQDLSLTPSLLSRLQATHIIHLAYPEKKQRESILKREGESLGLHLEKEYISCLASSICRDMRLLKTAVKRLYEELYVKVPTEKGKPPPFDIAFLDRVCGDLYSLPPKLAASDILKAVAAFYKVSAEAIQGPARDKKYSAARHLTAYLCTSKLKMRQKETAQFIGCADHSSVVYAREKVIKTMEKDLFFRRQVQDLCRELSL